MDLSSLPISPQFFILIITLAIFELVMKAFALWRSARMRKLAWFISILIINSAGVLPIIFLLVTNKQYKAMK